MLKKVFIFIVLLVIGISAVMFFVQKEHVIPTEKQPASPIPITTVVSSSTKESDIKVTSLSSGDSIVSPLHIEGVARGTWFFEATFPITLVDSTGKIIAQTIAHADGDWMTTDLVPFSADVTFEKPAYSGKGTLIFKKDNPSGLPEHDASFEVEILFK